MGIVKAMNNEIDMSSRCKTGSGRDLLQNNPIPAFAGMTIIVMQNKIYIAMSSYDLFGGSILKLAQAFKWIFRLRGV